MGAGIGLWIGGTEVHVAQSLYVALETVLFVAMVVAGLVTSRLVLP